MPESAKLPGVMTFISCDDETLCLEVHLSQLVHESGEFYVLRTVSTAGVSATPFPVSCMGQWERAISASDLRGLDMFPMWYYVLKT